MKHSKYKYFICLCILTHLNLTSILGEAAIIIPITVYPFQLRKLRLREGRTKGHTARTWLRDMSRSRTFNKYLLSTYYVLGTVLGAVIIHEPNKQPCPQGAYILVWRQTVRYIRDIRTSDSKKP